MLVEKYRPKTFEDVIGIPEEVINAVEGNNIMHLLFTGTAGTGKTTTAKIIVSKLAPKDTLMLNASNDRGIDIIREKVKIFAMTNSNSGNIKIVFLDEADYLTKDAQASLRNLMEEYSNTCKFILTGNYDNKIIEALKSRCSWFKFKLPEKDLINKRLRFISDEEKINIQDDAIIEITNKYYPDIRKCINVLQELSLLKKPITLDLVKIDTTQTEELFKQINAKVPWSKIRSWVLNNNLDYNYIITKMVDWVENNKKELGKSSVSLLLIIMDLNRHINICANPEVEFSLSVLRITMELNKKEE